MQRRSFGSCRRGFTLIELLIVIGILIILAALLLPAINGAREVMRRAQCMSNLRQVGIAASTHATLNGKLPPGFTGPTPASANIYNDQCVGVLAFLLPQLDQQPVYDAIGVDMRVDRREPNWINNTATWNAAETPLEIFLCPSDRPQRSTDGTITNLNTYYRRPKVIVAGIIVRNQDGADRLGRTNYVGVAGGYGIIDEPQEDAYRGCFHARSVNTMADIQDGISNTLMFGETVSGYEKGQRKYSHSWMGSGCLPTWPGLGDKEWSKFSGAHGDFALFCYADGSVRPVKNDIGADIYRALSGIQDREVAQMEGP